MNKNGEGKTYGLRRIRLINFHNFVDETIEVRHGGHLFLLGDNASGKTTVLDAAHYVLTAGESMEFNSAARVAASLAIFVSGWGGSIPATQRHRAIGPRTNRAHTSVTDFQNATAAIIRRTIEMISRA